MIDRSQITGLVLAGGRGTRMAGADKGLQLHGGEPLALHALRRLAAQVGPTAISANRHLEIYRGFGVPVWPDPMADFPGPLAGFLAGLEHCKTPWLVTVPCDAPRFPEDLVARLASAVDAQGSEIAIAVTSDSTAKDGDGAGEPSLHPVFCLMQAGLADSLRAYLERGQRKVGKWAAVLRCAVVAFDDAEAFANANTETELARLQTPPP